MNHPNNVLRKRALVHGSSEKQKVQVHRSVHTQAPPRKHVAPRPASPLAAMRHPFGKQQEKDDQVQQGVEEAEKQLEEDALGLVQGAPCLSPRLARFNNNNNKIKTGKVSQSRLGSPTTRITTTNSNLCSKPDCLTRKPVPRISEVKARENGSLSSAFDKVASFPTRSNFVGKSVLDSQNAATFQKSRLVFDKVNVAPVRIDETSGCRSPEPEDKVTQVRIPTLPSKARIFDAPYQEVTRQIKVQDRHEMRHSLSRLANLCARVKKMNSKVGAIHNLNGLSAKLNRLVVAYRESIAGMTEFHFWQTDSEPRDLASKTFLHRLGRRYNILFSHKTNMKTKTVLAHENCLHMIEQTYWKRKVHFEQLDDEMVALSVAMIDYRGTVIGGSTIAFRLSDLHQEEIDVNLLLARKVTAMASLLLQRSVSEKVVQTDFDGLRFLRLHAECCALQARQHLAPSLRLHEIVQTACNTIESIFPRDVLACDIYVRDDEEGTFISRRCDSNIEDLADFPGLEIFQDEQIDGDSEFMTTSLLRCDINVAKNFVPGQAFATMKSCWQSGKEDQVSAILAKRRATFANIEDEDLFIFANPITNTEGRPLGAICITCVRRMEERDEQILDTIAAAISLSLENALIANRGMRDLLVTRLKRNVRYKNLYDELEFTRELGAAFAGSQETTEESESLHHYCTTKFAQLTKSNDVKIFLKPELESILSAENGQDNRQTQTGLVAYDVVCGTKVFMPESEISSKLNAGPLILENGSKIQLPLYGNRMQLLGFIEAQLPRMNRDLCSLDNAVKNGTLFWISRSIRCARSISAQLQKECILKQQQMVAKHMRFIVGDMKTRVLNRIRANLALHGTALSKHDDAQGLPLQSSWMFRSQCIPLLQLVTEYIMAEEVQIFSFDRSSAPSASSLTNEESNYDVKVISTVRGNWTLLNCDQEQQRSQEDANRDILHYSQIHGCTTVYEHLGQFDGTKLVQGKRQALHGGGTQIDEDGHEDDDEDDEQWLKVYYREQHGSLMASLHWEHGLRGGEDDNNLFSFQEKNDEDSISHDDNDDDDDDDIGSIGKSVGSGDASLGYDVEKHHLMVTNSSFHVGSKSSCELGKFSHVLATCLENELSRFRPSVLLRLKQAEIDSLIATHRRTFWSCMSGLALQYLRPMLPKLSLQENIGLLEAWNLIRPTPKPFQSLNRQPIQDHNASFAIFQETERKLVDASSGICSILLTNEARFYELRERALQAKLIREILAIGCHFSENIATSNIDEEPTISTVLAESLRSILSEIGCKLQRILCCDRVTVFRVCPDAMYAVPIYQSDRIMKCKSPKEDYDPKISTHQKCQVVSIHADVENNVAVSADKNRVRTFSMFMSEDLQAIATGDEKDGYFIYSEICFPIYDSSRRRVLGVLQATNKIPVASNFAGPKIKSSCAQDDVDYTFGAFSKEDLERIINTGILQVMRNVLLWCDFKSLNPEAATAISQKHAGVFSLISKQVVLSKAKASMMIAKQKAQNRLARASYRANRKDKLQNPTATPNLAEIPSAQSMPVGLEMMLPKIDKAEVTPINDSRKFVRQATKRLLSDEKHRKDREIKAEKARQRENRAWAKELEPKKDATPSRPSFKRESTKKKLSLTLTEDNNPNGLLPGDFIQAADFEDGGKTEQVDKIGDDTVNENKPST